MANQIEILNSPITKFVVPTSRYISSKPILYGNERALAFTTYKRKPYTPSDQDRFTLIPPGEEYRPDLTSFRAYNTVNYWWLIMEVNGIFDVYDYKSGKNIRIPSPFGL